MEFQLRKKLTSLSSLTWIDWLLVIVPLTVWLINFYFKELIIRLECTKGADVCTPEAVWKFDRIAIFANNHLADYISYYTQYAAGVFAFLLPLFWYQFSKYRTSNNNNFLPYQVSLSSMNFTNIILILQVTFWNGCVNEIIRAIVQRPRPFVYTNPDTFGPVFSNYNSFYSGHTSFTAAAGTLMVLSLIGLRASKPVIFVAVLIALLLTSTTGTLRVLAGKHFPTDVFGGVIFGVIVAFTIILIHKRKSELIPQPKGSYFLAVKIIK